MDKLIWSYNERNGLHNPESVAYLDKCHTQEIEHLNNL